VPGKKRTTLVQVAPSSSYTLNVLKFKKFQPDLILVLRFLHERYIPQRLERRDRVLVHHLLAAIAVNDDREVVKRFNRPSDLEAVRQKYGDRDALFP
jgi:hypothetical protein